MYEIYVRRERPRIRERISAISLCTASSQPSSQSEYVAYKRAGMNEWMNGMVEA